MDFVSQLLSQYGVLAVFVTVLLNQGGIPVPAYFVLIVASSLAFESGEALWSIVLAGSIAAFLADLVWFSAGRRIGAPIVGLVCRLTLSPDACVSGVRKTFLRWGAPTLIVAKFVPGLAAVATTMAGQTRVPLSKFVLFDGLGAALWTGVAVALGARFHDAVGDVLGYLQSWGRYALVLFALLGGAYLVYRRLRRGPFERDITRSCISVNKTGLSSNHEAGVIRA